MIKEIWIVMEENQFYEISNYGRIKSKRYWVGNRWIYRDKILKPTVGKNGYLIVNINKKSFYVHRLVAKYFLKKEKGKKFVNHIDGNKENNFILNLEYCTVYENNIHAIENNLRKIKKIIQKDCDGKVINNWNSMKEIKDILGFDKGNICLSCKKGKKRYGYYWEYESGK